MPANMREIAAYLSPFCRNTRSDLKAASVLSFSLVFRKSDAHPYMHSVRLTLCYAWGVHTIIHGCPDPDLLSAFE